MRSGNTLNLNNSRFYIASYEFYEGFGNTEQTHTLSLLDEVHRFVIIENSNTYGLLMRYQHPNHQGSTTLETDESGNIITYEEYHPFGTTSYQATNASVTTSVKRYRYVGKERDNESGLCYYGARYYAPWLCRFISCDPKAAEFPNQSSYNYCFNNPGMISYHIAKSR